MAESDDWETGRALPSEDAAIAAMRAVLGPAGPPVLRDIGDDAALIAPDLVWTADTLVEDVHFSRATSAAADVGWRALAVNLSDLAAMGAEPLAALVALTLPPDGTRAVEPLYRGLAACARAHDCPVVGGDVTRGPVLVLTVTVLGRAEVSPPGRDGALPGDLLVVTGSLGASAAGLAIVQERVTAPTAGADLADRHRRPQPRLAEGRTMAPHAHAMMDLSDGLATDARRLAERSGVALVLDLDALPLAAGVDVVAGALGVEPGVLAATGGEDYELLAAIPPADVGAVASITTVVGEVAEGAPGLRFTGRGAEADLVGWDHLRDATA